MSDKTPKEIWIARLEDLQSENHIGGILTLNKVYLDSVKYISEAHHNEVVEGLKEGIRKLQEQFDENGGNLPPLIQLQRISANVTDIIKNYFEENKKLKEEIENYKKGIRHMTNQLSEQGEEIESLKSKAESKRKHWNIK